MSRVSNRIGNERPTHPALAHSSAREKECQVCHRPYWLFPMTKDDRLCADCRRAALKETPHE